MEILGYTLFTLFCLTILVIGTMGMIEARHDEPHRRNMQFALGIMLIFTSIGFIGMMII